MALTPIASSTAALTVDNTAGGVALAAPPAAAAAAKLTVYSNPIRYTRDKTAPTTTLGEYATDKGRIFLASAQEIAGFLAIREGAASATVIVEYLSGEASRDDLNEIEAWLQSGPVAASGTPVSGVAANYRIARGVATTVAASDTIVTGLTTVVAAFASLEDSPVLGAYGASAVVGDQAGTPAAGSILLKTWKPTGTGDATPIAATTFTKKVSWLAVGT